MIKPPNPLLLSQMQSMVLFDALRAKGLITNADMLEAVARARPQFTGDDLTEVFDFMERVFLGPERTHQ